MVTASDTPALVDAEEAFESGDIETALAICEGLIGEDERKAAPEVLYLAAECLLDLQEAKEAEHLFCVALKSVGDDAVLLHGKGVAVFEQGRLAEAAGLFEAAKTQDPDIGETWFYLGILAERGGDYEGAAELFAKAVDLDPEGLALPVDWTEEDVARAFDEIVEEIPDPLGVWLAGLEVNVQDLPSDAVLLGGDGPVSPLILCYFAGVGRGAPQGDDPDAWLNARPEEVLIFRRNLGKSAQDEYELHRELLEALLWELMEFLDLDDTHLAALGLPDDTDDEDLQHGAPAQR